MAHLPIIGIPCRFDISARHKGRPTNSQNISYINAVIMAGGVPVLIPVNLDEAALRQAYNRLDGVLLAGGGDIDPECYGEARHKAVKLVEPKRDMIEITITRWAVEEEKPVLGLCRGIQIMAVASDGELWQDIPTQVPATLEEDYNHSNSHLPRNTLVHQIELVPTSRLATIVGTTCVGVNSLHHQAVKQVPTGYKVSARSQDGLIEAMEQPEHHFCLGVQWHPEEMVDDEASARNLFAAFVDACY